MFRGLLLAMAGGRLAVVLHNPTSLIRIGRGLYPPGYFHIDIAEVHPEEGRLYLLVAIDRSSKFAFVEPHERDPPPLKWSAL